MIEGCKEELKKKKKLLLAAFYHLTYKHDSKDFNICNYKLSLIVIKAILTSAITSASINWTNPWLAAVAKTLYGVSRRSKFSLSNKRCIRVMSCEEIIKCVYEKITFKLGNNEQHSIKKK